MTTLTITVTNFAANVLMRKLENEGVKVSVKKSEGNKKTIERVLWAVCKHFDTEEHHLKSKSRKREYVYPRQVFFYLVDTLLLDRRYSLKDCGRFTGGRDHSTVLFGREKINGFLSLESAPIGKKVQRDVDEITKLINL